MHSCWSEPWPFQGPRGLFGTGCWVKLLHRLRYCTTCVLAVHVDAVVVFCSGNALFVAFVVSSLVCLHVAAATLLQFEPCSVGCEWGQLFGQHVAFFCRFGDNCPFIPGPMLAGQCVLFRALALICTVWSQLALWRTLCCERGLLAPSAPALALLFSRNSARLHNHGTQHDQDLPLFAFQMALYAVDIVTL